ncbi:endoplasmic reticulum lectin 1-like isoform X3 [Xenopus laevis]|uniref:Endoplasmic reticulum lectin n=1 Tax=Xenopus laevis TaxID=8355 RepID=A0A8J0V9A5_XENLA|nr:endoplasmic reticulum lectin 1-like isoform X3 [Xenopus laevis]
MCRSYRLPCAGVSLLVVLCGVFPSSFGGRTLPALSDDIPFRLKWPGPDFTLPTAGIPYREDNYIIMTTADQEKYKCLLPLMANGNEHEEREYKGPNPGALLEPLFKLSSCSYRIESYWTYEVCHGKYIRQYHEEKEAGQKLNIQEYYLGKSVKKRPSEAGEEQEKEERREGHKDINRKNIEGQMTPYFPVEMIEGTRCSLKQNQARSSTVLYICHPEAKHEILSVAEITTCEYEVVILTPLLCNHPKYRFRPSPINDIFCQSMAGSPLRPQSLEKLEHQQQQIKSPLKPNKEGVGWWKYEFCYGKYVHQYHEDKDSGKSTVVVGTWKAEDHLQWAKKNPARAYISTADGVQTVKTVSHFYGGGDLCEVNEQPRQVIVKLKCKQSESPHAVTVYMLEPQTCHYILGVESPVICQILDTADENGLLSVPN